MKRFAYDFERELVELESEIEKIQKKPSLTEEEERYLEELRKTREEIFKKTYSNLTPWQRVQLARHPQRPTTSFFIGRIFSRFTPINSDGRFPDDPAVICGIATYKGLEIAVAGIEKGSDSRERQRRRFGMPLPEGYYKFIRLLETAESLNLPVVTFVDTPGAFPGIEAEERGQALAIAKSIRKMLFVEVPTVSFIIGEGGSGGAIAMACADRIFVLENAYYSIISPEGCASILFRDEKLAPSAAAMLKLTARELKELGLIHGVVEEPYGSAARDPEKTSENIDSILSSVLQELTKKDVGQLLAERHSFFLDLKAVRRMEAGQI